MQDPEHDSPAPADPAVDRSAETPQEAAEETPAGTDAPDARGESQTDAGDAESAATVEAILFATDSPLTPSRISRVAELPGGEVRSAIERLNQRYAREGASFRIESIAGGYQMLTLPQYHDVLSRLLRAKSDSRLSQAALETLAIVAYRQPILRADIEAIRGVACGEVLRGLLDKNLIKIVGRAEVIGRPMLYGTTKHFLSVFGLASLDDLPRVEQLRGGADSREKQAKPPETDNDGAAHGESGDDTAEGESNEPDDSSTPAEPPGDGDESAPIAPANAEPDDTDDTSGDQRDET